MIIADRSTLIAKAFIILQIMCTMYQKSKLIHSDLSKCRQNLLHFAQKKFLQLPTPCSEILTFRVIATFYVKSCYIICLRLEGSPESVQFITEQLDAVLLMKQYDFSVQGCKNKSKCILAVTPVIIRVRGEISLAVVFPCNPV